MNFLANIRAYGTLSVKNPKTPAKLPAKVAFSKQVSKQIDYLEGNNTLLKRRAGWSTTNADGTVSVSLRNGVVTLPLDGTQTLLTVPNIGTAVEFLKGVLAAAMLGEFDELLAATQPKRGSKKAVL